MNFNTPQYALLLFVVFWAYWIARRLTVRHAILLAASYAFYGAWNPKYLVLIIGSTLVAFYTGLGLARWEEPRVRKGLLAASLIVNLGVLAVYKYFNFFMTEIDAMVGALGLDWAAPHLHVLLPVGISFYTFQTLSYSIDVYRRKLEHTDDLLSFATFVAFFPQLVAGPILRASEFLPQLASPRVIETNLAMDGVHRILRGLLKKAIFADLMGAMVVDPVFTDPAAYSSIDAVVAVYAYAIQIYADFSGYSDIAIGSAQLLGFRIPENFNYPYLAQNCQELWHRWHISLSSWLRDYLYIPLGGSRLSPRRTYINLMATMLLGGLWHGAGTTFIAWGGLHGIALAATRWAQRRRGRDNPPAAIWWHIWLRRIATFHFVCLGWIFFRARDFDAAMAMLGRIFAGDLSFSIGEKSLMLVAAGLAMHFAHGRWKDWLVARFVALPAPLQALVAFVVIGIVTTSARVAAPFIYFQF